MKLPKILYLTGCTLFLNFTVSAQKGNIVGNWQLVKQAHCMEQTADEGGDTLKDLRDEMHASTSPSPQIISFKSNSSGEESTRILNSGKTANAKKFYYKFNGEMLLILDKKSQTISGNYIVDKFTSDSLIVSNSSRPCEIRIFVKINQQPPN